VLPLHGCTKSAPLPDPTLTAQTGGISRNHGIRITKEQAIQRSIERVGQEVTDVSRSEGAAKRNPALIFSAEVKEAVFLKVNANITASASPSTHSIVDQVAAHAVTAAPSCVPLNKPTLTVAEVAELSGYSRQTITRMFEDEKGVSIMNRPETTRKRSYRSIRIPRDVYERVIRKITK